MRSHRSQTGYTLIEVMFVLGLFVSMAVVAMGHQRSELDRARAKQLGTDLYTYNSAVRSYMGANIQAITNGATVGVDRLKSATECGAPAAGAVGYLPCTFSRLTSFGQLSFSTTFAVTGAFPNKKIVATTRMPALVIGGKARADLSGLAALTAMGSQAAQLIPATSNTDGRVVSYMGLTAAPGDVAGVIEMTASTYPLTEPWLRTDGSNTMNAPIRFGGPAAGHPSILQAVAGDFLGLIGSNFTLDNTLLWSNVNTELAKQLLVRQQATFNGAAYFNSTATFNSTSAFNGQASFNAAGNAISVPTGGINVTGSNAGVSVDATGALRSTSFVQGSALLLTQIVTPGASCGFPGFLARDAAGLYYSCTGSPLVWKGMAGSTVRAVNGPGQIRGATWTSSPVTCASPVVDVTFLTTWNSTSRDAEGLVTFYVRGSAVYSSKTGGTADNGTNIRDNRASFGYTVQVACSGTIQAAIAGSGSGVFIGNSITYTFE